MPTQKAKRAAKIAIENPEKPMGTIMREAGYSRPTSLHPDKLTNSKGWAELMEEYLPDSLLGEKHKEFLTGKRVVRKWTKGQETIETEETDPSAVKALDMAYKLKRRYADVNIGQAVVFNITGTSAKKYGIEHRPRTDNQ